VQDTDGVILVIDPSHPEQEKELEQFYVNFAQPNVLTLKQCMVVAVDSQNSSRAQWGGKCRTFYQHAQCHHQT
jgi:Rab-like protein 5